MGCVEGLDGNGRSGGGPGHSGMFVMAEDMSSSLGLSETEQVLAKVDFSQRGRTLFCKRQDERLGGGAPRMLWNSALRRAVLDRIQRYGYYSSRGRGGERTWERELSWMQLYVL